MTTRGFRSWLIFTVFSVGTLCAAVDRGTGRNHVPQPAADRD